MASSASGVMNLDEISIDGTVKTPQSLTLNPNRLGEVPSPDISSPLGGKRSSGSLEDFTAGLDKRQTFTEIGGDMEILEGQRKQEKLAIEGARAGIEVFNAVSKYNQIDANTRFNLVQIQNQISDAVTRGHSRALGAQLEGERAADDASLSLAAQGQNLQGAGAQRVQSSYEASGLYNAMIEEINMNREIYGLELEEVQQDLALKNAEINRNVSVIGSIANLGANYAVLG